MPRCHVPCNTFRGSDQWTENKTQTKSSLSWEFHIKKHYPSADRFFTILRRNKTCIKDATSSLSDRVVTKVVAPYFWYKKYFLSFLTSILQFYIFLALSWYHIDTESQFQVSHLYNFVHILLLRNKSFNFSTGTVRGLIPYQTIDMTDTIKKKNIHVSILPCRKSNPFCDNLILQNILMYRS